VTTTVRIFCQGRPAAAFLIAGAWVCALCGERVEVVT
jgi:hypothetical protein